MVKNGADTPQKVEDLAKPLGIDPVLLGGQSSAIRLCNWNICLPIVLRPLDAPCLRHGPS